MREVKANFATARFAVGSLLFLCALTFYYFAVLRVDYRKTMLLDLGPHPDATEYFAQAKALRREQWPSIQIGYDKLPSRYPFGYPVLMLPWLKILRGSDAVLAPFRTNQTMGLLLVLAVFAFYNPSWLLHFLSFINERHQRIRFHCIGLYVCLPGT
jgi:hypothetical protein